LVHTEPELAQLLVNTALSNFGIAATPEQVNRFWFCKGRDDMVRNEFGLKSNDFWPAYGANDTVELRRMHARPYPDVGFLADIKSIGYKLGIVTGAKEEIAEFEISLLGRDLFDEVIIAHPSKGIQFKPHPNGIEECLRKLGIDINKAMYVGNADEDVICARAAGVLDVLVDRKEAPLNGTNPSHLIKSLYELPRILNK
jgi:phosphoglycolate phosphatase-like HAD superfamily hydrolase